MNIECTGCQRGFPREDLSRDSGGWLFCADCLELNIEPTKEDQP